ncbi:hypothetical protein [Sphingorhabdus sp. Alg231-15]|uniref:hypothetical protein n=1 Tax=Sphingorhabdus sp. Alg231-15 TaxID=1922222 RepID=UPI00307C4074
MTEDERDLAERYQLGKSIVLISDDEDILKWSFAIGFIAFLVAGTFVGANSENVFAGLAAGVLASVVAGFWWFNEKRETIFMRDLIHGRRFKCGSIVELAKKEALLDNACIVLRQVLETAKHWDGVETVPVPSLPREEAKDVVVKFA